MSELEPDDSRDVTLSTHRAPGEPPRTGPREDQARVQAEQGEGRKDERAIEGDSPAHPDRFGETAEGAPRQQEQSDKPDRWSQQAEREDYVPEGK